MNPISCSVIKMGKMGAVHDSNFYQLGHAVLTADLSLYSLWLYRHLVAGLGFFFFIHGGLAAPSQVEAEQ